MDLIQQPPNRSVLPVAAFNPNPQWPGGYLEVLEEAGVPEKQHGFYAHWVRQLFNRFPEKPRRSLGPQEIADFLESLKLEGSAQDWQLVQARDALILYYEQFRGIPLRKMPKPSDEAKTLSPTPSPRPSTVRKSLPVPTTTQIRNSERVDWNALKEAVVETLRVKNYPRNGDGRGADAARSLSETPCAKSRNTRRYFERFAQGVVAKEIVVDAPNPSPFLG